MRILLIEDTRAGITDTVARLAPYGEVRAARSLDEARVVIASGFDFDAIVTDLHLGDRRDWSETINDVVEMANGRPIAAHTADLYPELRREFARLFSGRVDIFSKRDAGGLIEWAQQFRSDHAGRVIRTMDRGSAQSHSDIRAEIISWLHDLGFPQPVEYNLRKLIEWGLRCLRRLAAARDIAAKALLTLAVTGAATMLASVLWNAKW